METILITGKTGLFPMEELENLGKNWRVLVSGAKTGARASKNPDTLRFFPAGPSDSDFQKLFETGRIRAVWHVSSCTDGGRAQDERSKLETILHLCARFRVPRLIVLTEKDDPTDYRRLIREWSAAGDPPSGAVDIAVVRLPLLSASGLRRGRINRIFSAIRKKRTIYLDGYPQTEISVLPMRDLISLLVRMTSETWFRAGIFSADANRDRLESFREILLSVCPDAIIEYSDGDDPRQTAHGRQSTGAVPRRYCGS